MGRTILPQVFQEGSPRRLSYDRSAFWLNFRCSLADVKRFPTIVATALAISCLVSGPSAADPGDEFAQFIGTAKSFCPTTSSIACVERLWPLADRNGDGGIQLSEATELSRAADAWSGQVDREGKDEERDVVLLALMIVKASGLPTIFSGFDADADGRLTREELLADFRLDHRPFGEIVADSEAVDWARFARRFGLMGAFVTPAPEASQ